MEDSLSLDEVIEITKKVDNWVQSKNSSENGFEVLIFKGSLNDLSLEITLEKQYGKQVPGVNYNYILSINSFGMMLGNYHSIALKERELELKKLYHSIEYKTLQKALRNARNILSSDKAE